MPSTPVRMRSMSEHAAALAVEVDLGDVAGDDGLGVEADAREEHLHLFGRRVLRLVENDEGVVQSAPAHEGERGDFDGAVRDEALGTVGSTMS